MPHASSAAMVRFQGNVDREDLGLIDAAGQSVPFQLSREKKDAAGNLLAARISFFAELKAKGSYRYELRPGPRVAGEVTGIHFRDGEAECFCKADCEGDILRSRPLPTFLPAAAQDRLDRNIDECRIAPHGKRGLALTLLVPAAAEREMLDDVGKAVHGFAVDF